MVTKRPTISSEHLMSGSPKDRGGAIWKWTPKDENKPVEGYGIKRVELKKSAVVVGDIYTEDAAATVK